MRTSSSKSDAMVLSWKKGGVPSPSRGVQVPQRLFIGRGRMEQGVDKRISGVSAVMRTLHRWMKEFGTSSCAGNQHLVSNLPHASGEHCNSKHLWNPSKPNHFPHKWRQTNIKSAAQWGDFAASFKDNHMSRCSIVRFHNVTDRAAVDKCQEWFLNWFRQQQTYSFQRKEEEGRKQTGAQSLIMINVTLWIICFY